MPPNANEDMRALSLLTQPPKPHTEPYRDTRGIPCGAGAFWLVLTGWTSSRPWTCRWHDQSRIPVLPMTVRPVHRTGSGQSVGVSTR
jgi:hypothetical protein